MIDALVHGRLVHRVEVDPVDAGTEVIGRIVTDGGQPIQFTARRGSVRRALMALSPGFPVAVAGSLSTSVACEKDGKTHYVRHDLLVTALMTAEPSTSGLAAFFRKATA